MTKRVSITGPESTGKSSLAAMLAEYYGARWVPEYAMEYLHGLNRPYTKEDIVLIAKGQLQREEEMARFGGELLFCDTDLLVTRIWSEFKYGTCDEWLIRNSETHIYDLYLLCDIDLPWEEDPLREHPDKRRELLDLYTGKLKRWGAPYAVISGRGEERLSNAISAVNQAFKLTSRHG